MKNPVSYCLIPIIMRTGILICQMICCFHKNTGSQII